jgi:hypothetical protein
VRREVAESMGFAALKDASKQEEEEYKELFIKADLVKREETVRE